MKLEIDRCRFSHASSVMHAKGDTFFALPQAQAVLLVSHTASFRFGCPSKAALAGLQALLFAHRRHCRLNGAAQRLYHPFGLQRPGQTPAAQRR